MSPGIARYLFLHSSFLFIFQIRGSKRTLFHRPREKAVGWAMAFSFETQTLQESCFLGRGGWELWAEAASVLGAEGLRVAWNGGRSLWPGLWLPRAPWLVTGLVALASRSGRLRVGSVGHQSRVLGTRVCKSACKCEHVLCIWEHTPAEPKLEQKD